MGPDQMVKIKKQVQKMQVGDQIAYILIWKIAESGAQQTEEQPENIPNAKSLINM